MLSTFPPGSQQPGEPAAAESNRRRRETAADIVHTNLDALDDLAGEVEGLRREMQGYWDLSRARPNVADVLSVRIAVTTARATLSAENRAAIAARLKASPLFAEDNGE